MTHRALVLVLAMALAVIAGCMMTPTQQRCRRFEGLALTPENRFSGNIALDELGLIDEGVERLQVALSVVHPVRGSIELVQIVGGREIERWRLKIPSGDSPIATCNIGISPSASGCHATIKDPPHPAGGYYYIAQSANTVYEAGLSFYLCD